MSGIAFDIAARDGRARTATLRLPRGEIRTPAFMPVGTAGTVKAMLPESVRATGADVLLGNTYHLMLRPGAERVARLGGLHRFMNWDRPILTDSGGFQVMSLSDLRKLTEEGVTFRSHVDGSTHFLSPETSMEIQRLLGSDIVMCFDECPALPATEATVGEGDATSRCAGRSARATPSATAPATPSSASSRAASTQELRAESAEALTAIGFDGYAIGGLAVGEGQAAMLGVLDHAPADAARRPPALPDGRRQARRHRRRRRPRHRHVRLRPADPLGPHRPGADPPRRGQPQATPATPRTRGPLDPRLRLPGLPRATAAPTFTTSSRPARSSPPCCSPGTTSITIRS